jgi:hypothetical protein
MELRESRILNFIYSAMELRAIREGRRSTQIRIARRNNASGEFFTTRPKRNFSPLTPPESVGAPRSFES